MKKHLIVALLFLCAFIPITIGQNPVKDAVSFDGDANYIRCWNLGNVDNWTMELRFKPKSLRNYENLFHTHDLADNLGVRLEMTQSGALYVSVAGTNDYTPVTIVNQNLSLDWHHVVIVGDKSNNKIYAYLDGKKAADQPHTKWPTRFPNFVIGRGFSAGADRNFSGTMNLFRIWKVAYPEAQVLALKDRVLKEGNEPNLLTDFNFNRLFKDEGNNWRIWTPAGTTERGHLIGFDWAPNSKISKPFLASNPDPIDEGIWFVIQNKSDVDTDFDLPARRMALKTNNTAALAMASIPLTGNFDEFLWRTVTYNGALKLVNKKLGDGFALDCSLENPTIGQMGPYGGQEWFLERSNLSNHGTNVYTMSNSYITKSKSLQYAGGAVTVTNKNASDTRQCWVFQPIDLVAGYKIPVIATHGYDRSLSLPYGYQVVASNNVSDWAMLNAHLIYKNMLGALNSDKMQKIQSNSGKKTVVMISRKDPNEVNSNTPYLYSTFSTEQLASTRGGVSNGLIVITEEVMNTPGGPVDQTYREFDQVVHEMAHEIDVSCALNAMEDPLAAPSAPLKSEWFPWRVQNWFNSSQANGPNLNREKLISGEKIYLAAVFNANNTWLPPRWLRNR